MSATDQCATEVLSHYPAVFRIGRPIPFGNHGGFSGARRWRVEASGHAFCLRAWPSHQPDPSRLEFLHRLMRRARSNRVSSVPAVLLTEDGRSHVERADQLWDLTEWMPGVADFHSNPTRDRLEHASAALAGIHDAWERYSSASREECPALLRRLDAAASWQGLRRSGWQPRWDRIAIDPVRPVAERAWRLLDQRIAVIPGRLRAWADWRGPLQPCLCDVWHDHLLFVGDRLTGLIDYGAVKIDHPAVDGARLLGSQVPDDPDAWQAGLGAYRFVRPFSDEEAELALALDETGTVIGVATWLRWLYEEFRSFEDRAAGTAVGSASRSAGEEVTPSRRQARRPNGMVRPASRRPEAPGADIDCHRMSRAGVPAGVPACPTDRMDSDTPAKPCNGMRTLSGKPGWWSRSASRRWFGSYSSRPCMSGNGRPNLRQSNTAAGDT